MLTAEEIILPVTLTIPGLTDATFEEYCEQYPGCRLEYTAEGELLIMPPTDPETGIQNIGICRQLANWAEDIGGNVTDSSSGSRLRPPDLGGN